MRRSTIVLFIAALVLSRTAIFAEDPVIWGKSQNITAPVGWDLVKLDNGAFLKPLTPTDIKAIRLWTAPLPESTDRVFDDVIEAALWKSLWDDGSFWQSEFIDSREYEYSSTRTNRLVVRSTEWSCTEHIGSNIPLITNCYRFAQEEILVASYVSATNNPTDDDAHHARDELQRILTEMALKN